MICNRCKVDKDVSEFIHGKSKCRECYKKCCDYYKTHRKECIARAKKSINRDRLVTNSKKRMWYRNNLVSYMLSAIKARAKKRNIPFDITHSDIVIPEKCPILGIKLKISEGSPSANSPSLDRINPKYGYVKGNVQVISHRANTIKSDSTVEEIRMLLVYMEKEAKRKNPRVKYMKEFKQTSRYVDQNKHILP